MLAEFFFLLIFIFLIYVFFWFFFRQWYWFYPYFILFLPSIFHFFLFSFFFCSTSVTSSSRWPSVEHKILWIQTPWSSSKSPQCCDYGEENYLLLESGNNEVRASLKGERKVSKIARSSDHSEFRPSHYFVWRCHNSSCPL